MDFTTTTKLSRNGKKEFDHGLKIVLHNNQDIGMIVGKDFYDAIKDSGLIEQIREELWEANDKATVNLIENYENGTLSESISLDDFKAKNEL